MAILDAEKKSKEKPANPALQLQRPHRRNQKLMTPEV
jgi:hypothetical protein